MIITEEIEVVISSSNIHIYKNIFKNIKIKDVIKLSPLQLMIGSHVNILCSCDICGKEKNMMYKTYYKITKGLNEKYYCQKCSKEKWEKTNLERYGSIYPQQNELVKKKIIDTNINRYGVEHSSQLNEYKEKQKQTNLKTHGMITPLQDISKRKMGMIEKYGVDVPIKSEILKNKICKTNIEKYGVDNPWKNKDIRKKIRNTNIEKYGCENPSQNKEVREKFVKTCIERYGFGHHFQNVDMYNKLLKSSFKMKKYEETDLYYQGTYEKDFLNLCEKINILEKIERGITIKYNVGEKDLIYFPDFYIKEKNLLIEIKSLYWYDKYKEKNIIKEKTCKELGFNYLLIMNKDYNNFLNIIRK